MTQDDEIREAYKRYMLFAEVFTRVWRSSSPTDFRKLFEITENLYNGWIRISNAETAKNPIRREGMEFISYCDAEGNLLDEHGKPVVLQ